MSRRQVSKERASQFAAENGMGYVETSARAGTNVSEAFLRVSEMIYKKVAEGRIDATKETSGVSLGSVVKVEHMKSVQEKVRLGGKSVASSRCSC